MSWKEAQQAQYDYSDDEEYSDDEYEPVNVSSWGNQTVTQEGTTQIEVTMDGWNSLVDPSVKVKAGGIGSGQLHRRGANFKPLDEQLIINQRLGKPIPKALGGGKKKGGKKPKPPPAARRPPPPSSFRAPSSSAYRSRELVAGQSPWGSAELASTPFWEQPSSSGTNASKYATPAPVARPPPQQYQQPPPPQQYQQPPSQQYQQPPQQQQYQQPPQQQYQQPVRQPEPANPPSARLGTSASKYATSEPQQYQQYSQPVQQQPRTVYHKLDVPCLNFNIEMAPGITAKLSVYEDDDPVQVVDKFEKDHAVTMSDLHKRRFAEKVAMLLAEYKSK